MPKVSGSTGEIDGIPPRWAAPDVPVGVAP